MLNRSASLAMSTRVLKALPGKLDIKRHLPSILYLDGRAPRIGPMSGPVPHLHKRSATQHIEDLT